MDISELSQNQKIYALDSYKVREFKYVCIHPSNQKYSILLDENEEPFNMFNERLQEILNKNLTYESATRLLINFLENKSIALSNSLL